MSEQTTNHEFRAETRKVLNILTHSLYSNREIFLRELISNASDALDKLRFLQSQTQQEAIRDAELPLEIRISSDKVQNCLTITDTGIGMTRDEMIENLGTIAHSGSEAFLKEHTQTAEDGTTSDASNIIGRFGIGFYSVFMVADKVEVTSLSATGDGPAYRWISDGTGTFTVEEAPDQADIKRGTTIRAFIKESDKEFLEKYRIEGIIRTHSSFIPFPILVDGERVNTTPALWREPKFSIKKEQYDEFYKFLTYDQKDPLDVLHLSVDAPVQPNALLFIPGITKDYFGAYREHWGLDLYARRVLIQRENKELIPDYLAFLKGVVDTEDLPLNISRETLQENIVLRKISQTISKQILSHLEKMAKDDAEKYNSFWKLHGKVFKLGYSDFVNRDRITPLLRFNSSAMEDADGLTSLDDYISRARESQKEIWYVAAPSREAAKVNPHSEVFRRKGLEVLYLYEPVDEFALETLAKYKDYTFKAVEHAEDDTEGAWRDMQPWRPDGGDILIGVAASGTTPYVVGGLRTARAHGLLTGAITCNPRSPVAAEAEYALEAVVGPEFVTGSTRMKAGTAQKLMLNMISTAVMIRLGRVEGNKMVNMQLTNNKLVDRGTRMIVQETGIAEAEARALLLACGSVKAALDKIRRGE